MSKRDKILLILHTIDYKYNLHQHFILPISWLQKFKEKSKCGRLPTDKHVLLIHLVFPPLPSTVPEQEHSDIATEPKQTAVTLVPQKLPKYHHILQNDSK